MTGCAESGAEKSICTQCHGKATLVFAGRSVIHIVGNIRHRQAVFVYFVDAAEKKRRGKEGEETDIVNFYDKITCHLWISNGKNKIKSANFTNFRHRMPLFSEYYEKFKKLYFLD